MIKKRFFFSGGSDVKKDINQNVYLRKTISLISFREKKGIKVEEKYKKRKPEPDLFNPRMRVKI